MSVSIPSFNGARYIREAIASVLEQTFEDFELIVVDDASNDGTPELVESIRDRRVRVVRNPSRLGLVGNWNRCLDLSRGRYVTVFHQDDLMAPDNLECKVRLFEEYPAIGFVHSNVAQIDARGGLLSMCWYDPPDPADEGRLDGRTYFHRLVTGVNIVCAPSVVILREALQRLGGFDPRLPFTADWEMWLRIALFYDVGYLGRALVRYRRHHEMETERFSLSQQLEQAYLAKMLALERSPDRLADGEGLRRQISQEYRRRALDQARKEIRDRRPIQASECLAVALSVSARVRGGGGSAADEEAAREVLDALGGDSLTEPSRATLERQVRDAEAHAQQAEARAVELARKLDERDRVIEAMSQTRVWQTAERWWSVREAARRLLSAGGRRRPRAEGDARVQEHAPDSRAGLAPAVALALGLGALAAGLGYLLFLVLTIATR